MDLTLACALISTSTILYSYIWKFPEHWQLLVGKTRDPSLILCYVSVALKLLQFSSCFFLVRQYSLSTFLDKANTNVLSSLLFLLLFIFGQALNLSVYYTLSQRGVYYGALFGVNIKWITSWPYSVYGFTIQDPQYLGCIISAVAVLLFLNTVLNNPTNLISLALLFWILNYITLIFVEKTIPGTVLKVE